MFIPDEHVCHQLIQQANIQIAIFFQVPTRQESKRSHAIIEIDKDELIPGFLDDLGPVVVCIGICRVSTSLDKHPDGQFRMCGGIRRSEHIDKEAILCSGRCGTLARSNAYGAEL